MKDSTLELLALCTIIIGLVLGFFFILDYTPKDAFFSQEEKIGFLKGNIITNTYNEESGFTYLEIYSCKTFNAFYKGQILNNESIFVKGNYEDNYFSIEEYE